MSPEPPVVSPSNLFLDLGSLSTSHQPHLATSPLPPPTTPSSTPAPLLHVSSVITVLLECETPPADARVFLAGVCLPSDTVPSHTTATPLEWAGDNYDPRPTLGSILRFSLSVGRLVASLQASPGPGSCQSHRQISHSPVTESCAIRRPVTTTNYVFLRARLSIHARHGSQQRKHAK